MNEFFVGLDTNLLAGSRFDIAAALDSLFYGLTALAKKIELLSKLESPQRIYEVLLTESLTTDDLIARFLPAPTGLVQKEITSGDAVVSIRLSSESPFLAPCKTILEKVLYAKSVQTNIDLHQIVYEILAKNPAFQLATELYSDELLALLYWHGLGTAVKDCTSYIDLKYITKIVQ